jgi:hypothetical protein
VNHDRRDVSLCSSRLPLIPLTVHTQVTWRSIFMLAVITMSVEIRTSLRRSVSRATDLPLPVVLYSTMSSQSTDALNVLHTPATDRRIWAYSTIIVLICKSSAPFLIHSRRADFQFVATLAQHLTSTAISAAFLKISNPRWLDPSMRKLGALNARRSSQGKRDSPTLATNADSQPVDKAQSPSTDRDTDNDGRGFYFTCVPLFHRCPAGLTVVPS